jgi:hypothetical protein
MDLAVLAKRHKREIPIRIPIKGLTCMMMQKISAAHVDR